MKVVFIRKILPTDRPDHINLEPEGDRDEKTLLKMIEAGVVSGFGKDASTGKVKHVQLQLRGGWDEAAEYSRQS